MTRRNYLRYKMYNSFLFEVTALVLIFSSQTLYPQNITVSILCFVFAIGVSFLSFPFRFRIFRKGFSEINKILVKQLEGEMRRSAYIDLSGFILFVVVYFVFPQSLPAFIVPLLILSAAYRYRLYLLERKLRDITFEGYTQFASKKSTEERIRIARCLNLLREKLKRGKYQKE